MGGGNLFQHGAGGQLLTCQRQPLRSGWHDASYYGRSAADNPQGPDSGDLRVLRGGCVKRRDPCARCALRSGENPNLRRSYTGLRVCLSP
jgi:formylglycine-generating enzyme required for sulfatase activity